ncbi:MAG: sensor histidine kinase [Glaciihabitans sp.]|nr:sensor histidine kinase [Glaciihabitans sp.]
MSIDTQRRERPLYWRLWASVPRELGFLLVAFPIGLAGFVTTIALFSSSLGTFVTFFIGVFILIAALYVARGFATLVLVLLAWTGRPRIERPEWQDARARQGFWAWLRAVVGNGHYWLALLHTLIVNFPLSLFSWIVTVVWLSVGLGGVTSWFWQIFLPNNDQQWFLSKWVIELFNGSTRGVDLAAVDSVLYLVLGLIMLALLPLVTRGLVQINYWIARGMLGAWKSDALQREVIDLNASRGAAAAAEGHSLRRLERDIHDGPQQRLVRLQMDLAAADRQLDADPAKARELLGEAMQQSKEALEELRSLSRGFAPPILSDRGLVAALESAAIRSPLSTRVVDELPAGIVLPQEIERNAYFAASEALTNAIKHSGATEVEIRVTSLGVRGQDWLEVFVTDNGSGGATASNGHGLAGLEERMRGVGGTLTIQSPVGGPTTVSALLPLGASNANPTPPNTLKA